MWMLLLTKNAGRCGALYRFVLRMMLTFIASSSLVNMLSGIQSLMTLGCTVSTFTSTHFLHLTCDTARNACIWYYTGRGRCWDHSTRTCTLLLAPDFEFFHRTSY